MVQEFYDSYIDDIKTSRITGDVDSLYEKIGKDNFLELNKLVNDFSLYFNADYRIYKLYDELDKKLDTDNVRFFYECINKRDELLSRMKEVNLSYVNNNSFAK